MLKFEVEFLVIMSITLATMKSFYSIIVTGLFYCPLVFFCSP